VNLRQGAPTALADQAEIRPEDFLGRHDDLAVMSPWNQWGSQTFGFGGGREDIWDRKDVYWGSEDKWPG